MPGPVTTNMSRTSLSALEAKLDRLIQLCERLRQENKKLREQETGWLRERTRLIEKNELARARVEAMITRLKSLEAET
jgi:cell division protein ZapB